MSIPLSGSWCLIRMVVRETRFKGRNSILYENKLYCLKRGTYFQAENLLLDPRNTTDVELRVD